MGHSRAAFSARPLIPRSWKLGIMSAPVTASITAVLLLLAGSAAVYRYQASVEADYESDAAIGADEFEAFKNEVKAHKAAALENASKFAEKMAPASLWATSGDEARRALVEGETRNYYTPTPPPTPAPTFGAGCCEVLTQVAEFKYGKDDAVCTSSRLNGKCKTKKGKKGIVIARPQNGKKQKCVRKKKEHSRICCADSSPLSRCWYSR